MSSVALVAMMASSCKNEDKPNIDTTKPTAKIEIVEPGTEVPTGSTVELYVEFSDDQELTQARVDIHSNFDHHTHQKVNEKFEWSKIIDISGGMFYSDTLLVDIPADVLAGPYHLEAVATDKTGNISDETIGEMILLRPDAPKILVISPDTAAINMVKIGETLQLRTEIRDNIDLVGGEILLQDADESRLDLQPIYDDDAEWTGSSDTMVTLDRDIPIEPGVTPGKYILIIQAKDNDGNLGIREIDVQINE